MRLVSHQNITVHADWATKIPQLNRWWFLHVTCQNFIKYITFTCCVCAWTESTSAWQVRGPRPRSLFNFARGHKCFINTCYFCYFICKLLFSGEHHSEVLWSHSRSEASYIRDLQWRQFWLVSVHYFIIQSKQKSLWFPFWLNCIGFKFQLLQFFTWPRIIGEASMPEMCMVHIVNLSDFLDLVSIRVEVSVVYFNISKYVTHTCLFDQQFDWKNLLTQGSSYLRRVGRSHFSLQQG